MISKQLQSEIQGAGFKFKTFKVEHIMEVKSQLEEQAAKGLFEEVFYKKNLCSFNYDYNSLLENSKYVILIAAPQGKSIAEFKFGNRSLEAVVPPTYVNTPDLKQVVSSIRGILERNNYKLAVANVPLKLMAVRSGLSQYGRNNITYVPGIGSFYKLVALLTDYEFDEDSWGEMQVMESCSSCTACIDSCPTGAISSDRFLLHGNRCITYMNEFDSPIPDWVNPEWHDSVVGCMKCQTVCPHNTNRLQEVCVKISFDEAETKHIMDGSPYESLEETTKEKLKDVGISGYYSVLSRNIGLLLR
jgi:epoxyqueuosine reductase